MREFHRPFRPAVQSDYVSMTVGYETHGAQDKLQCTSTEFDFCNFIPNVSTNHRFQCNITSCSYEILFDAIRNYLYSFQRNGVNSASKSCRHSLRIRLAGLMKNSFTAMRRNMRRKIAWQSARKCGTLFQGFRGTQEKYTKDSPRFWPLTITKDDEACCRLTKQSQGEYTFLSRPVSTRHSSSTARFARQPCRLGRISVGCTHRKRKPKLRVVACL